LQFLDVPSAEVVPQKVYWYIRDELCVRKSRFDCRNACNWLILFTGGGSVRVIQRVAKVGKELFSQTDHFLNTFDPYVSDFPDTLIVDHTINIQN
jgi:hypothetical protein